MSWFKTKSLWMIEIYSKDEISIKKKLKLLIPFVEVKFYSKEIIPNKDWVKEGQVQNFDIKTEFFLISQNIDFLNKLQKKYFLKVPASNTFGTGTHASTFLAIRSIEFLYKFSNFKNILDIGTGSGILSLVLSKLTKKKVLSSDFDENSKINFMRNKKLNYIQNVKFVKALDFKSKELRSKKFDLIVANILLNPLISLSEEINKYSKHNSYLILSGILENQLNQLYSYYSKRYKLVKKLTDNEWTTLILKKNGKKT
ncbi:50S ribosomal protein L11 methyltransferase [Rickettsiales bacterium]|nr:50S ribosomal protein L11 methyltransferase [Rickettsiales bacterium]